MLGYFPAPYKDELFYSVIARYHIHSGNINFVETARDLYGKTQLKAVPDLITNLNKMYEKLDFFNYPSKESLIENHTMYLYFTNFTDMKIKENVKQIILQEGNLSKAYRLLGTLSNKIKENKFFKYCPKCLEQDAEDYGETYWHLSHQLPSSFYCIKHPGEVLLNSKVLYRKGTRTEFKAVAIEDFESINFNEINFLNDHKMVLTLITNEGIKLARNKYSWNLEKIYEVYRSMLNYKGYLSAKGTINQMRLGNDFTEYYGEELLSYLKCELKIGDNNCWLRLITSKHRSIFHPLKHILLLVFLNESLESIEIHGDNRYLPFGEGKFPCLNPAAKHYKELCIDEVIISRERNRGGKPRGVFTCSLCGFTYSRIGPDETVEDRYKYNKVMDFGPEWLAKLKSLVHKEGLTQKEAAMSLNVSAGTVTRYLNGFQKRENKISGQKVFLLKQKWLSLIQKYPGYSQNQIRNLDKGLYSSLYAYDSKWLKENSPKPKIVREGNRRVNWNDRDKEYLGLIKSAIETLETELPPKRITFNSIENEVHLNGLSQKIDKMPQTKEYLVSKLEEVEEFQIRRAKWVIKEMKRNEEALSYSKVLMKANVYRASKKVLDDIRNMVESEL